LADLILTRVRDTGMATYGVLTPVDPLRAPFAVTLERPWVNNTPQKSCIPVGVYECQRINSPKFGNTFTVTNVPNRSHILFHAGNIAADSLGCILIGHGFDAVKGTEGVVSSAKEFQEFLKLQLGTDRFTLTVRNA
jgi:hypothetical protein